MNSVEKLSSCRLADWGFDGLRVDICRGPIGRGDPVMMAGVPENKMAMGNEGRCEAVRPIKCHQLTEERVVGLVAELVK